MECYGQDFVGSVPLDLRSVLAGETGRILLEGWSWTLRGDKGWVAGEGIFFWKIWPTYFVEVMWDGGRVFLFRDWG